MRYIPGASAEKVYFCTGGGGYLYVFCSTILRRRFVGPCRLELAQLWEQLTVLFDVNHNCYVSFQNSFRIFLDIHQVVYHLQMTRRYIYIGHLYLEYSSVYVVYLLVSVCLNVIITSIIYSALFAAYQYFFQNNCHIFLYRTLIERIRMQSKVVLKFCHLLCIWYDWKYRNIL